MLIDRAFQKHILNAMADAYPNPLDRSFVRSELQNDRGVANLLYLEEHGLCIANVQRGIDGHFSLGMPQITARGIDFITDDGGLSAILGTVTVKLHDDTLRQLLAAKIDASALPPEKKKNLKDRLASLSGKALGDVGSWVVEKALEHIPDIAEAMGDVLPL